MGPVRALYSLLELLFIEAQDPGRDGAAHSREAKTVP